MRRLPENTFDRPWLVLCEGESDKRFLDRLIQNRGIENDFYVQFPDRGATRMAGRSVFGRYLSAVSTNESFLENVSAVLIISDNDDNPGNSFAEVQEQLRRSGGFGIPDQERQLAESEGFPDVVVLMIPFGENGNLETLCLPAAYSKWNIEGALENFIAQTPANNWTISKKSKSRIQAILAATCEAQPDTSFANHWVIQEEYQVPLNHNCFNDLADFLSDFQTFLDNNHS